MQFLSYIVLTAINVYIWILILRIWMQWVRADFYNPFAQFIVKVTHPVVKPVRRFIPAIGPIDTASFTLTWVLMFINITLTVMFTYGKLMFFPSFIVIAFIKVLVEAGTLVFWLLIISAIMSWINPGRNPIAGMISQLIEPILAPVRRILPTLGVIDLSPMVIIFVLYGLRYLAADVMGWLLPMVEVSQLG